VEAGAKRVGTEEKKTESGNASENPLIPNERLRQIYRAMAQARALEKALPAAKRARAFGQSAKMAGAIGLEAWLVSAAADLGPCDLVSDALAGGVVEYLRGAKLKTILNDRKATQSGRRKAGVGGGMVCGSAGRLPPAKGAAERIWMATGAAAGLKAAASKRRSEAETEDVTAARDSGVVIVYIMPSEVTALEWKKYFKYIAEHQLPLVLIILPSAHARSDAERVSGLAGEGGVPAIVVEVDDAVAIYRVAQESIGHARIGGGAALIVCVPYELGEATRRARVKEDAITGLERYMELRGVASRAWIEREAKAFAKRLAG
jgi:TPP-dependent pyruvate/acetoin dehydrogenase alpha subunit